LLLGGGPNGGGYNGSAVSPTTASGYSSVAIGDAVAQGSYSFAMGGNIMPQDVFGSPFAPTYARGNSAMAFGEITSANGNDSFAVGFQVQANGLSSTASGYGSCANGNFSFATGYFTQSNSNYQVAIGVANIGGSVGGSNPLFEVGNGSASAYYSSTNSGYYQAVVYPSDAFVVYRNGNATVTGTFSVSGSNPVLVYPAGDLSMGGFQSGPQPYHP